MLRLPLTIHLNHNRLASWKGTTETKTLNICLENKLAADNYGRNTIKTPSKISSDMSIFLAAQNGYNC